MGITTRYYDLTGGLNTSQGIGTVNQSNRKTDCIDTYNVEFYKLSGLKSMEGNSQVGQALPAQISLGHEYRKGSDKYMIITTTDGNVYIYNNITQQFDNIYKFDTPTIRHSACNFNQGVIISNGVDDLVYYQYGRNTLLDGTITLTKDSATVTGVGTSFTVQLGVGDFIQFDNIDGTYRVESITSDTELTLSSIPTIPENSIQYYCWTFTNADGSVSTYYTTTLNNTGTVDVYEYNDGAMNFIGNGSIANNSLVYTTTQTNIVTKTEPVYSCYKSTRATVEMFGKPINNVYRVTNPSYMYFSSNPAMGDSPLGTKILDGSVSYTLYNIFSTTTSDSNELNDFTFTTVNPNGTTTENKLVITAMSGSNPTQVSNLGGNYNSSIYPINWQLTRYSDGDITRSYQTTETVTKGGTYTRNQSGDVEINVPIEGIHYYMTPISELNATYINSDDETVNYKIRGLSLNAYQGRIFVGANDGNLYYSELGLIHGWDVKYGAGAIPEFYNDNSDFTGLGIYGEYLVIHKRDYTYCLNGQNDPDSWSVIPFADVSADSQQSFCQANNAYYVYSRRQGGIYPLFSRTIYINNYLGQELSIKIRETFKNLNTALYNQIFPVFHPNKKYLMFYMPMLQGSGSNHCYVYDFISKSWLVRIVPQKVTIAFRFNDKVYIGTADGRVLEEFKGNTFNGEPIEFSWKSPWFDYKDGTNYLSTREFRCKISEEFTNNFFVRNRRDGYDSYKERNVTNNKQSIVALEWSDDAGTITDTVWDEYEWVESGFLIKRFPLPDQFFTSQQIEFYGNALGEGMCLLGFELDRVELEENPW